MDLLPILLLILGAGLLLLGFLFNKEDDQSPSQSNVLALRKEISALRDEVRRNDAKNDLVQREILLVRAAIPDAVNSKTKAVSSDDNVKGIFESRFGDSPSAKTEKNKEVMSLSQQGLSNADIAEELSMNRDTVSMIINNYKRA